MPKDYDFGGWATKNDLLCSDGRVIKRDAFKVQDGERVPLVWNHQRNSVSDILGHGILENRNEGVYVYGYFNDTPAGRDAKESVRHGDVTALSIWANKLQQNGRDVVHGTIREVSLVVAGANPGAFIESVVAHGEPMDDYEYEGIFYTDEDHLEILSHSEEVNTSTSAEKKKKEEDLEMADENQKDKTIGDVYDAMTDEQKKAVAFIVGAALENAEGNDEEEDEEEVKHNIFDQDSDFEENGGYLSHADYEQLFKDAKRIGSLREAIHQNIEDGGVLAHAISTEGMTTAQGESTYGFNDPDMLFPDYRALANTPEFLSRNMDWVGKVLSAVHHSPFSRVKSVFADITEDDARARGYIKGKEKKEEVFALLKRTTDPQTIYKKQKIDRDDLIDITDLDVVAWIRAEMRVMLNEEIARAILIGDGRSDGLDEKIKEDRIRPVAKDVPLFNTTVVIEVEQNATSDDIAKAFIRAALKARKDYKGSGNPTLWTTEDLVTDILLLENTLNERLYKSETEIATAVRVRDIVTVEPMVGQKVHHNAEDLELLGVIVNLADYNVGTNRGGEITMFDDFDIDYNQQKYLLETRMSGALTKPYSALTFLLKKKMS